MYCSTVRGAMETDQGSPLARFRGVARFVRSQLRWTKPLSKLVVERDTLERNLTQKEGASAKTSNRRWTFDVDDFKRSNNDQPRVVLSPLHKAILSKSAWEREERDLDQLTPLMTKLKCFSKYSPYVLYELSRVLFYETQDKGKVVVRRSWFVFLFCCFRSCQRRGVRNGQRKEKITHCWRIQSWVFVWRDGLIA
eukprot:m.152382 g.152382  ORF g.152382 m.152382 type:complete len:195 (+) comp38588_c0_seq10:964-1548(+)